MTDRTDDMNPEDELHPEDRAIEQALSRAMATGSEPRLVRVGDGADGVLVREYTELLGLLPYELPAETPGAHVREQLMTRVAASTAGTPAGASVPPRDLDDLTLYAPAEPDAADLTLRRPAAEASAVDSGLEAPPPAVPFPQPTMVTRPAWGTWAMAAVLALCLVGMGFLSAVVWQQSQQIDQLNGRLAASPLVASPEQSEVARVREQLGTLQGRLDMITNVAQQAYPLRGMGRTAAANQPHGVVYVCGNHQQWYLSLRGLEPPAEGEEYRLWFMTDQGKTDGGILEVRPDATSEREDLSMPAGTHGFAVTLEKRGPDEPESLTILLGESAVRL